MKGSVNIELKENAIEVIRILYNESQEKKTLKINLSYTDILKKIDIEGLTPEDIKCAVEYLKGHNNLTYKAYPLFNDICITANGIDYYNENFE